MQKKKKKIQIKNLGEKKKKKKKKNNGIACGWQTKKQMLSLVNDVVFLLTQNIFHTLFWFFHC